MSYNTSTYSIKLLNPGGLSRGIARFNVNGENVDHIPIGDTEYDVEIILENNNKSA